MKALITVMTSRYTAEAIQPNSPSVEVIKEKLEFLNKWEDHTDKKQFLSQSTTEVLTVTPTSTLELLDYLHKKVGSTYLMTSRFSQDKVENFFGIVRMSSGCNTHPTPQQFLLTVNCLSFYNLARSETGSNSTADTISSILSIEDSELKGKKKLTDTVNSYFNKQAPATESTLGNAAEHPYHACEKKRLEADMSPCRLLLPRSAAYQAIALLALTASFFQQKMGAACLQQNSSSTTTFNPGTRIAGME
ncbi:hypothetical protein HPB50_005181 [Hyalomma asiaticum]|uniref:Uncharacterized protein n=1 Tax=Hyalomma asiaticum TaxID=266040 RepID=A0ACB7RZ57_HYAAI|nr:hypothetical protein HPB50_005181 [Hyalomma asiaticum]